IRAPASRLESSAECGHLSVRLRLGTRAKKADHRHRRLLPARRERPRGCCAAESQDELAPFHSITSSARARTGVGMSSLRFLAVFRLITSSYLVGACTGRSLGFSPLSTRAT